MGEPPVAAQRVSWAITLPSPTIETSSPESPHLKIFSPSQVWNSDMSHTRDNCGVYSFVRTPGTSNAKHCERCFCYVCDVPVAECAAWGNGMARTHH